MIDGVLDLLSAILVLGIVVAVAFGFIIPLTDADLMLYDDVYQDKGIVNAVPDYSDPDTLSQLNKRLYTYEELVLLLYVQDDKMEEPRGINFRNTIIGRTGGYNNSLIKKEKDNPSGHNKININEVPNYIPGADSGYQAIKYFAENNTDINMDTYPANKDNIGKYNISGDFFTKMTGQFGIAVKMSNSVLTFSDTAINGPMDAVPKGHPDYQGYLDSLEDYNNRRYYYISYRFALPDGSNDEVEPNIYLRDMPTTPNSIHNSDYYHRNYDEEDSYFIEIQGIWPNDSATVTNQENAPLGSVVVDTWKDYQQFLSDLRKDIKNK